MHFTFDRRPLTATPGDTVLQAVRAAGLDIPTLCNLNDQEPNVSCFLCVVHVQGVESFQPACALPVAEGMVVTSDSPEVRDARRNALELLLSDHAGRCAAPCVMACPAHFDISGAFRALARGAAKPETQNSAQLEARRAAWEDLVFPGTLGMLCPGFCQKVCVRKKIDTPLAIRDMHLALARETPDPETLPAAAPAAPSGKRAAILGSSPAALAAAFYLLRAGHACTLYSTAPRAGEPLWQIPAEKLDHNLLKREIDHIFKLGARLHPMPADGIASLYASHDVILSAQDMPGDLIPIDERATTAANAAQNLARSVAAGRRAAAQADAFLRGENPPPAPREFYFLSPGCDDLNISAAQKTPPPPAPQNEAARCLQCNCSKESTCRLRLYAAEYKAVPRRFKGAARTLEPDTTHDEVVYEPGKCILCGICLKIAQDAGNNLGLCFSGRGFDTRVSVPWGEPLSEGLRKAAAACARACPTAALSLKEQ